MYLIFLFRVPANNFTRGNMKTSTSRGSIALVVVTVFSIVVMSCARTKISSQVNRSFGDRQFQKLMVYANFQDLDFRRLAEEKLYNDVIGKSKAECVKAIDVFFPAQTYSSDEVLQRFKDLSIDGILTLQPTGAGTTTTYIPKSSHTTGSAYFYGNTVVGSSRTYDFGGFSVSKPRASYEAVLQSTEDGSVFWYATAKSKGNAFAGWENLIKSASGKVVNKLVAEGLLTMNRFNQVHAEAEKSEMEVYDNSDVAELNDLNAEALSSAEAEVGLSLDALARAPIYIDVVSSVKDAFIMVIQPTPYTLSVGDVYELVQIDERKGLEGKYTPVGTAKVILVKGEKVVLKYAITEPTAVMKTKLRIEQK